MGSGIRVAVHGGVGSVVGPSVIYPKVLTLMCATSQSVFPRLEPLLPTVQKPIQYVGGELNSTVKEWASPEGGRGSAGR